MSRRIFFAVDIEKNFREAIYSHALKLFSGNTRTRIIPGENLHITLKFIGNTSDRDIEKIKAATGDLLSGFEGFSYSLEDYFGAFPQKERARIVFVGIKEGSKGFKRLFDILEDALSEIGIMREKRAFHPHITAARVKRPFDISDLSSMPLPVEKGQLNAGSVTLYESILGKQGARYINIERFVLK